MGGMEDNAKNGVVMKFTQPVEARMPTVKWRLYCFTKQNEQPKIMHIHRQVGFLFGKDRKIADVPTDHATCSKQHAVLHHRLTSNGLAVKPYIMDLESINGTFVNGEAIIRTALAAEVIEDWTDGLLCSAIRGIFPS